MYAQCASKMHLVEQVGSGIGRMRELMEAAKLKAPEFQKSGMFTVTFFRPQRLQIGGQKEALEKTTQKTTQKNNLKPLEKTNGKTTQSLILKIIKANPKVSRIVLAEIIGNISANGIKYHLKKLKESGILERIGSDKGGYWQINEIE
jgi:ATP-dependent DNA helicase RecG